MASDYRKIRKDAQNIALDSKDPQVKELAELVAKLADECEQTDIVAEEARLAAKKN